jgi:cytochrome c oxidase subunit 4
MSLLRSSSSIIRYNIPLTRLASTVSVTSTRSNATAPLLANIEASWKDLPAEEQYEVYHQLEELQKKDWKELTVDEKKAGECLFF